MLFLCSAFWAILELRMLVQFLLDGDLQTGLVELASLESMGEVVGYKWTHLVDQPCFRAQKSVYL